MGVFSENALGFFNAGLMPLPIRADHKKRPAVKGHHGYEGKPPTREDIIQWILEFPDCNIAIRLPPFIVGIDIDAYEGKKGAETLEKLEKELGKLPPSLRITSREDNISGIRLYRLPAQYTGNRFIGTIPNHIDILHWGNRYAVAPPSLHATGRRYRWLVPAELGGPRAPVAGPQPDVDTSDWLPRWEALPSLPGTWCERIRAFTRVPEEIQEKYSPKFSESDGTRAGLAVLKKEIEVDWPAIRDKVGWNNSFYVAVKRIAELVAGGELAFEPTRKTLIEMAYAADPSMEGIESTVDSGFRTGLMFPRVLSQREEHALPDGYRATDIGNAQRLYEVLDNKARFVLKWNNWIVYDKGVWHIDDNQVRMFGMAKQVSRNLHTLAAKHISDETLHKSLIKHAYYSSSVAGISNMIKAARDLVPVTHSELDQHPEILNVRNGEIDLRTGTLHPHNPNHLLTTQAPVNYNPNSSAPVFLRSLNRWQPDLNTRLYLQKVCGSGLIGRVIEHFFVNFGDGQNGKSKFYGAIQHVLGAYYVVPNKALIVRTTHEPHPTVKASLFGKRFAVAAETEKTDRLSEASIKDLTGSDLQTARRMREDEWLFEFTHTLFIHTNHRPEVRDPGVGMWRRIRVIPWSVQITDQERDTMLLEKLYAEAEGILNWLVEGARLFLTEGIANEPVEVIKATADYKNTSNEFGQFLSTCTVPLPKAETKPKDLYNEYLKWCKNNGRLPTNGNQFGREMTNLGVNRKMKTGTNYYVDVQIIRDDLF